MCRLSARNTPQRSFARDEGLVSAEAGTREFFTCVRACHYTPPHLNQAYPKIALAVFLPEMEERLISVCLATKEQMEPEYRRVRRRRQLTMLEDQAYKMKSELQKKGLAHLDSRMTKIFQQSKSK